MKRLFYLALIFFLGVAVAFAGEISVTWDANTEPDLQGYRVFITQSGTPFDYSDPVIECDTPGATIQNLVQGVTYDMVCRAYDNEQLESGDSNMLTHYEPNPWEGVAPAAPQNLRKVAP